MKRLLMALGLAGGMLASAAGVAHADTDGVGLMNYDLDPAALSITLCGYRGVNPCRRLYVNGTWDSGRWTGGYNGALALGWAESSDQSVIVQCGQQGRVPIWYQWSNATCLVMYGYGTGTFQLQNGGPGGPAYQ